MIFLYTLAPLALLSAAFAAALFLLHRRSRDARRQLAQEIHDRSYALDRRADLLQEQLDHLAMHRRIDHLDLLIDRGERNDQLSAAVAKRLRHQTLKLHEECSE